MYNHIMVKDDGNVKRTPEELEAVIDDLVKGLKLIGLGKSEADVIKLCVDYVRELHRE